MSKFESYPFKNVSKDAFTGKYDGEDYIVQGGETRLFPVFIVNALVSQFLDWAVNTEEFGIKKADGTFDKPAFLQEKRAKMEAELRVIPPANPEYVKEQEHKVDVFVKEAQKEEKAKEDAKTEVFKCEVCGRACKSKLGLVAHMRAHK